MGKIAAAVTSKQLHEAYDAVTSVQQRAQSKMNRVAHMLSEARKTAKTQASSTTKKA